MGKDAVPNGGAKLPNRFGPFFTWTPIFLDLMLLKYVTWHG